MAWATVIYYLDCGHGDASEQIVELQFPRFFYFYCFLLGIEKHRFSKMKTYLLDILNRYNRFSENLDVKTILCNKSWLIFNDSGEKELYIFQENGSLIASINGNVTNAAWQYISANKSLLISFKEQSYMLHPAFMDETIFALQLDGTNECFFMIDENNISSFKPKTLLELNSYFERKEQTLLTEIERKKHVLKQQQSKARQAEINYQKKIQEEERIKLENKAILAASTKYKWTKILCNMVALLISLMLPVLIAVTKEETIEVLFFLVTASMFYVFLIFILWVFVMGPVQTSIIEKFRRKGYKI